MNQAYRIGDQVVIYKTGEFRGMDGEDMEISFKNGLGVHAGTAWVPLEFLRIQDEGYMIVRVGTITGASYSFLKREVDYQIQFDCEGEFEGFASVPESMITPPADQVLRQSEIQALRDHGISA